MAVMCPYDAKCQKPGQSCPHYRPDDVEDRMSCHVAEDFQKEAARHERSA